MGWDVVQIGLSHDLPVHDHFAMAKEIAKRMNQNVRLVYRNEFKYDIENNCVSNANGLDFIELGKFEVNGSHDYLRMIVSDYQAHQIHDLVGIERLRNATYTSEFAKLILNDIENTYDIYEIEDAEGNVNIRIFEENVDLDIFVPERWMAFARTFHPSYLNLEWLRTYRMRIYHKAKMFGCKEVIICSDQGPTELIYNNMHYSSNNLKEYVHSLQYLNEATYWFEADEKEEWEKHAKQIMFSSVFQNKLALSNEDFVEVVFDDFSDIDLTK